MAETDRAAALLKAAPAPYSIHPGILWALQGALLAEAEALYGPRDHAWTICQPMLTDLPQPMAARPAPGQDAIVVLLSECDIYPDRLLFQMAHEVIHLVSPSHSKPPLRIEEGMAVHFSRRILGRVSPGYDTKGTAARNYVEAHDDFESAISVNSTFVTAIRAKALGLYDFTPELIAMHGPKINADVAARLCLQFDYESAEPQGLTA